MTRLRVRVGDGLPADWRRLVVAAMTNKPSWLPRRGPVWRSPALSTRAISTARSSTRTSGTPPRRTCISRAGRATAAPTWPTATTTTRSDPARTASCCRPMPSSPEDPGRQRFIQSTTGHVTFPWSAARRSPRRHRPAHPVRRHAQRRRRVQAHVATAGPSRPARASTPPARPSRSDGADQKSDNFKVGEAEPTPTRQPRPTPDADADPRPTPRRPRRRRPRRRSGRRPRRRRRRPDRARRPRRPALPDGHPDADRRGWRPRSGWRFEDGTGCR